MRPLPTPLPSGDNDYEFSWSSTGAPQTRVRAIHDVRDFGSLTASDAGAAATNAATLQAAIDTSTGVYVIPEGTFYYNTALIPKTGVVLRAATRGATTLIYTGSGNAIDATIANRASGIYRAGIEGITFQFGGSGSGNGFNANVWRYSWMRDCRFKLFPGNGVHLDGNALGTQGCWTNRFDNVECEYNGGNGWYFGLQSNAVVCHGCIGSVSGLDGFRADKNSRVTLVAPQAEANGRHAFTALGVQTMEIIAPYVEHQSPEYWGFEDDIPGYVQSSDRYVVYVTQSSDAETCKRVSVRGGHLEGGDNGGTSTTKAIIYAEHCISLVWDPDYIANARSNRGTQIQSTVRRYATGRAISNASDDTVANSAAYLNLNYDYANGGSASDRRGMVGREEGFANLVINGGFDADLTAATTVPLGWTQLTAGTYSFEAGTDGGNRFILTNSGTNQSSIYQDVTGPQATFLASVGFATIVFDSIVPTTNAQNGAQVRVRCRDSGGSTVSGGGLESWNIAESNSEVRYHLTFPVPATTTQLRIMIFSSTNGVSNTDVIKVDRLAIYPGEVPKAWQPGPITERGGRLLAPFQIPTKAGAPADSDFPVTPSGACLAVYDSTNNRLYVRGADGTWRYAGLT